ncbi:MAG: nitronate monooxygenase [Candidatus Omnitrophica bacterium]|nr:nitronate monooxygenase [Candidatus Omnitrophota bacterium]
MSSNLNPLRIGDLEIKVPIIQGGMGVRVSTASLASAVAKCGGAGTIASVALGYGTKENETNFPKASREGLQKELRDCRAVTDGAIGVNILVALSNYEDLARVSARDGADFIISGAGLPLKLPEFTEGTSIKLIPIVSSAKAARIISKVWKKRYNRLPDAFVVEGPFAGGHLGFTGEQLRSHKENNLSEIVKDVLAISDDLEGDIPVIAAGGIFDGADIAHYLKLGAKGVQMATRFVVTDECSVADAFKQLYINATDDDVIVIDSPVGLPGRVIKTKFTDRMAAGERIPVRCGYRCLKVCNPAVAPYCIAKALFDAVIGDLDNAVVFAGSNVSRVKEIVSVEELMNELAEETIAALNK